MDELCQPPAGERWTVPAVSFAATMGLVISVVAGCAVLTGLLAKTGYLLGNLGVLVSMVGLLRTRRPVLGNGIATMGVLIGLSAAVLAALAMTRLFTWPDSQTDAVAIAHGWLAAHWPWLHH